MNDINIQLYRAILPGTQYSPICLLPTAPHAASDEATLVQL